MIKLPSIKIVLKSLLKTILRFPFETLAATISTITAIYMVELTNISLENKCIKIIFCSSLGLVLFLSSSLFSEIKNYNKLKKIGLQLLFSILLVAYYFSFSEKPKEIEIITFVVLNISFHLLVSFSSFIFRTYSQEEFWEFNKKIFLRLVTTILYSAVLYIGLTAALRSIKELFNIAFNNHMYLYLFFIIAGIFNSLFFLYGIPELSQDKLELSYPKSLKKFTQYILIPLISIYSVILLCYEIKIILTLDLPIGHVSYLILVFAIFGILSFLLIHPIAKEETNQWIKIFSKWFYYFLIPLLGLLFWAIGYRIQNYGFTYNRYYVLLLALWLTIVVLYFLFSKSQNIRFIPLSMCIAGLLSVYGPQSAVSVSKSSQLSRIEYYLQKNRHDNTLEYNDQKELESSISFILKNYDINELIKISNHKLDTLIRTEKNLNSDKIMKILGINECQATDIPYFYYQNKEINLNPIYDINGYDIYFRISSVSELHFNPIEIKGKTITIHTIKKDERLELKINHETLFINVNDFVEKMNSKSSGEYTIVEMTQNINFENHEIKIIYKSINGTIINHKKMVTDFSGDVFVKIIN